MGRIVGVEDRDREIVAVDDVDRAHDEGILRRKEFMTAPIPRGHLIKNPMTDEPAQDLAKRRYRGECFDSVPARVDDLQALVASPLHGNQLPSALRLGGEELHALQEVSCAFPC